MKSKYFISALALLLVVLFSCKKKARTYYKSFGEPQPVSDIQVKPTSGGAIIYEIPAIWKTY